MEDYEIKRRDQAGFGSLLICILCLAILLVAYIDHTNARLDRIEEALKIEGGK
jgi:hypothetical protein